MTEQAFITGSIKLKQLFSL